MIYYSFLYHIFVVVVSCCLLFLLLKCRYLLDSVYIYTHPTSRGLELRYSVLLLLGSAHNRVRVAAGLTRILVYREPMVCN